MIEWVLTPALVALRATFDRLNPKRDKSSDGSIGDAAHAGTSSDHNPDETGNVPIRDADSINEVHAIDVDETGPWPTGFTMMKAVRQLVTDHRTGAENRLRYIIYERTIWSASWGWAARDYTGANPHDKHAHFSGSYDTAKERDTSPWNIGQGSIGMADLTAQNLTDIANAVVSSPTILHIHGRTHALLTGRDPSLRTDETNALHRKVDAIIAGLEALGVDMRARLTAAEAGEADRQAALLAAVASVDEAVAERLGDGGMTPEQVADVLRRLPGVAGREAAVGAALSALD